MCGIVALLGSDPAREEVVAACELLAHRGPDDAGVYVGDGVALAARRLSIIDLAAGHQPLCNEDGTIWIAYNGEVMNAPELRAELAPAGHTFRTQSDTEVIVHAYEEWGEAAVTRLRGMFAFALWDGRRRRLLLARDRFGIKPLYYAQAGGRFACASEIRPLFAVLPALARRANPEALWRLFEVGFIPTPLTAFAGVHQLPAGHTLTLQPTNQQTNQQTNHPTIQPYWQLNFPPAGTHRTIPPQDAAGQFITHLRDAVAAWRLSDVPVGALLSGGVDSSTLAALLTEVSGGPIHTFNIAFAAGSHDESAQARATARFLGSHHHELTFSAADFDHLPAVVRHLEAPQCSATGVPIHLLYRACRDAGFKVIMTGEGADELLAGYHWFDGDRRVRQLLWLPRPGRALLARLPANVSDAGRRVLAHGDRDPIARYALWQQVSDAAQRRALLRAGSAPPPLSRQWRERYGAALRERHPLDQFLFLDSQTRMVDFINFEVDRMSMANSVEARPPFLDHRLWEFCATLPPTVKLNRALNKWLLRQGMAGRLPPAVRHRPKKGLATPHAAWWRRARLPAWAEACLHPAGLAETGYFDPAGVARLREEHRSGRGDHSRVLMGVLTTQLWHQEMGLGT